MEMQKNYSQNNSEIGKQIGFKINYKALVSINIDT